MFVLEIILAFHYVTQDKEHLCDSLSTQQGNYLAEMPYYCLLDLSYS